MPAPAAPLFDKILRTCSPLPLTDRKEECVAALKIRRIQAKSAKVPLERAIGSANSPEVLPSTMRK